MSESRTKKTIRNTAFSIAYKVTDLLFQFLLRTIFIYTLGKSYLGLSGLFTNILTVLSMMELGVGGAIVFSLYKPLAECNYRKVAALMQLYKRVYTVIGILVCTSGVLLTPFLKYIINLPNTVEHIYWIYWLYIGNTAISYFLAYRRSLLIADQRSDINLKNQIIFRIIRFVLLSAALIITRNFIIFLALDIFNTFVSNVHITILVKKRYDYIEKSTIDPITDEEKNRIVKYMMSGIFSKFGQTIVNSTDSLIISAFVGTILVGLYSNYSMITSSLDVASYMLFSGITASIGNFAVKKSSNESEVLFKRITFGNYIIALYLSVCLFSLLSPFVSLWAGEDYVLSDNTVIILVLNFYIACLQKSIECFMGANGEMYYHNRYRSLVEGIVNLVVSIVLVKYTNLGITAVFIGTTACFIVGRMWMDAFVLYKYWFKKSYMLYIKKYVAQFTLTVVLAVLGKKCTSLIFNCLGLNFLSWILSGLLLSAIVLSIVFLLFRKRDEFSFFVGIIIRLLKKVKSGSKQESTMPL